MQQTRIVPLYDRVVIKRLESEEKTSSGIIIPDTAKEKAQQGEVVAVGAGKPAQNGEIRQPAVKIGDRVLFGKYSGTEIKLDSDEFLVIKEDEILAVIGK